MIAKTDTSVRNGKLLQNTISDVIIVILIVHVQDGAEYGSRVASSGKTLQFFVCFISFFVVLHVRCC